MRTHLWPFKTTFTGTASLETNLSLFFFQLCFCLFHFVDKHLSHLLLFALQVPQELFPLGLISLLKTGEKEEERVGADKYELSSRALSLRGAPTLPLYLNGWLSGSVSLKPISSSLQRRYSS